MPLKLPWKFFQGSIFAIFTEKIYLENSSLSLHAFDGNLCYNQNGKRINGVWERVYLCIRLEIRLCMVYMVFAW